MDAKAAQRISIQRVSIINRESVNNLEDGELELLLDELTELVWSHKWQNEINNFIVLNCVQFQQQQTDNEQDMLQHMVLHAELIKLMDEALFIEGRIKRDVL